MATRAPVMNSRESNQALDSAHGKLPHTLHTQFPDSPASWTVGAQTGASYGGTQRTLLSPGSSPMQARTVSAQAAAFALHPGSDGHRRAHIQSLAKMTREALAERLFGEKQINVTLQERLVRLTTPHAHASKVCDS